MIWPLNFWTVLYVTRGALQPKEILPSCSRRGGDFSVRFDHAVCAIFAMTIIMYTSILASGTGYSGKIKNKSKIFSLLYSVS